MPELSKRQIAVRIQKSAIAAAENLCKTADPAFMIHPVEPHPPWLVSIFQGDTVVAQALAMLQPFAASLDGMMPAPVETHPGAIRTSAQQDLDKVRAELLELSQKLSATSIMSVAKRLREMGEGR